MCERSARSECSYGKLSPYGFIKYQDLIILNSSHGLLAGMVIKLSGPVMHTNHLCGPELHWKLIHCALCQLICQNRQRYCIVIDWDRMIQPWEEFHSVEFHKACSSSANRLHRHRKRGAIPPPPYNLVGGRDYVFAPQYLRSIWLKWSQKYHNYRNFSLKS